MFQSSLDLLFHILVTATHEFPSNERKFPHLLELEMLIIHSLIGTRSSNLHKKMCHFSSYNRLNKKLILFVIVI